MIGFPSESHAGEISNSAVMAANAMYTVESARKRPGHILMEETGDAGCQCPTQREFEHGVPASEAKDNGLGIRKRFVFQISFGVELVRVGAIFEY